MMPSEEYFYSYHTSLHIDYCCVVIQSGSSVSFAFVKLRNDDGSLADNVQIRDVGPTASPDYSHVGYSLNRVKPFYIAVCKQFTINVKILKSTRIFTVIWQQPNSNTPSMISKKASI